MIGCPVSVRSSGWRTPDNGIKLRVPSRTRTPGHGCSARRQHGAMPPASSSCATRARGDAAGGVGGAPGASSCSSTAKGYGKGKGKTAGNGCSGGGGKDWVCAGCRDTNFAYRGKCRSCGIPREPPAVPPCPTHRRGQARPDDRFNWNCGNCSDNAAFRVNDMPNCPACSGPAPPWYLRGFTSNENRLGVAKKHGNDTRWLEKEIKAERKAFGRRAAAPEPTAPEAGARSAAPGNKRQREEAKGKGNGKGSDARGREAVLEAQLMETRAELKRLQAQAAGAGGAAGNGEVAGATGEADGQPVATGPAAAAPKGEFFLSDEAKRISELDKEIHTLVASVNRWDKQLNEAVAAEFEEGEGEWDWDDVDASEITGGIYRRLNELSEELANKRELRRSLLPIPTQLRNGEHKAAELERKLAANRKRLEDEQEKHAALQEQVKASAGRISELEGFIEGQAEALETQQGELERLRAMAEDEGDMDADAGEDMAPVGAGSGGAAAADANGGLRFSNELLEATFQAPEALAFLTSRLASAAHDDPIRTFIRVAAGGTAAVPAAVAPAAAAAAGAKRKKGELNEEDPGLQEGGVPQAPSGPAGAGSLPRSPIPAATFSAAEAAAALAPGGEADEREERERTPRGKAAAKQKDDAKA